MKKRFDRFLDISIIILTFVVLIMLIIDATQELNPSQQSLFAYVDTGICIIFLFEFFYRIRQAESKVKYFRKHWIDLLSSIPFIEFLRIGRLLRLVRLMRIVRVGVLFGKQAKRLAEVFEQGTFTLIALIMITVLLFGSTLLFFIEKDLNDNVNTFHTILRKPFH